MRIDRCPEFAQKIGKRIAEILVLPTPETMPPHDDATAKDVVIRVKTGDGPALLRGKKLFHHGVALLVQVSPDPLPVEPHQRARLLVSARRCNSPIPSIRIMRAPPFREALVFALRPSGSPTMRHRYVPRDGMGSPPPARWLRMLGRPRVLNSESR